MKDEIFIYSYFVCVISTDAFFSKVLRILKFGKNYLILLDYHEFFPFI